MTDKEDEPAKITTPDSSLVIDPQDPLPEPSFLWRRVLTFVVVLPILGLMWHSLEALHQIGDSDALLNLSKWVLCFAALISTYYFVAPTAAELTKLIQSARIIRTGLDGAEKGARNRPRRPVRRDFGLPPSQGSGGHRPRAPEPSEGFEPPPITDDESDFAPRGRRT